MNRWQVVEQHHGILGELLTQIIRQCLNPGRIPGQSQRQRRSILHIPARREGERRSGPLPGLGGIAEEGFSQGRFETLNFRLRSGDMVDSATGSTWDITGRAGFTPFLERTADVMAKIVYNQTYRTREVR